ncbi:hypothetical protein PT300_15040 [Enterobacteriaceae bacterium ESL0689]|nr:hypothetical protein [Enterobacteriaceae bacterium ESL0689]
MINKLMLIMVVVTGRITVISEPGPAGVIDAASLNTDSAEKAQRAGFASAAQDAGGTVTGEVCIGAMIVIAQSGR